MKTKTVTNNPFILFFLKFVRLFFKEKIPKQMSSVWLELLG
jgi:hypothetical protein